MRHLSPIVVPHILCGHSVLNFIIIKFRRLFDRHILRFVKQFQNLGIGAIAERAKESRRQKFATPFLVQMNPEHVVGVKLRLVPRPAIRYGNDSEGVKHFSIVMRFCLKL